MRLHFASRRLFLLLALVAANCQGFVFVASSSGLLYWLSSRNMTPRLPLKRKMTESSEVSAIVERTDSMEDRAKEGTPLQATELGEIIQSVKNIAPEEANVDYVTLRTILQEVAHLSHKDWSRTADNALKLGKALLPDGMSPGARAMFSRILEDGGWDRAAEHGPSMPKSEHPWAVLVTGVNGIRKTTSMYQEWFPDLLAEALVAPDGMSTDFKREELPCGENSFFRQLDHMIATLCNEDFAQLYLLTKADMGDGNENPSQDTVRKYSNLKAAIFTRYRTLSELLGVLLLREAQKLRASCMMETSGRDVAMFHYVDSIFPAGYNKLALHFVVNDLSCAKESVDARMVREIKTGIAAVDSDDVKKVVGANAGGPYGSEVLSGVQEASDRVWNDIVLKNDTVGKDWWKATIAITAHPTEAWTAQAIRPDGTRGGEFTFERLEQN